MIGFKRGVLRGGVGGESEEERWEARMEEGGEEVLSDRG